MIVSHPSGEISAHPTSEGYLPAAVVGLSWQVCETDAQLQQYYHSSIMTPQTTSKT